MKDPLSILTYVIIAVVSFVRLRLGIVRYFDPDEFAYLNWAYHVSVGYQPYKDFMMLVTPLHVVFTAPIFWIWQGTDPAIIGRIVAWGIFILLCIVVGMTYWQARKTWLAGLAVFILLILPMPSDKFIEFRPDTLALLFFFIGLWCQMLWDHTLRQKYIFLSGLLYALAFLTLQKIVPFIAIVTVFILFRMLMSYRNRTSFIQPLFVFVIGISIPLVTFVAWAFTTGNPALVWYSVVKLPVESAVIERFNRVPTFFYFLPNTTYYGSAGYGLGLLATYALWIGGLLACFTRLASSVMKREKGYHIEICIALLFVYSVVSYLWIIPLKHPQYLMFSAPFAAWYIADAMHSVWDFSIRIRTRTSRMLASLSYGVMLFVFSAVFYSVHTPKFAWTNAVTLQKMKDLYAMIPKGSYVLDLEGRTIYYPYPYYVCCLSFGQFGSSLSVRLPSMADALRKTNTTYVYQAEINRIGALSPEDRHYIESHYGPVANGDLFVAR